MQDSELEVRSEISSVIVNFGEEMGSCSRYSFEFIEATGKNLCVPAKPNGLEWCGEAVKNLARSGQVYVRLLYDPATSGSEGDLQEYLPHQSSSYSETSQLSPRSEPGPHSGLPRLPPCYKLGLYCGLAQLGPRSRLTLHSERGPRSRLPRLVHYSEPDPRSRLPRLAQHSEPGPPSGLSRLAQHSEPGPSSGLTQPAPHSELGPRSGLVHLPSSSQGIELLSGSGMTHQQVYCTDDVDGCSLRA